MSTAGTGPDDFDAGKAIFEQLKDLPRERQERILRWVREGLGLEPVVAPVVSSAPAPPVQGGSDPAPQPDTSTGSPKDIKTFILQKSPASDQQFAAAVAYYYKFAAPPAERKNTISAESLQEATRLAGRNRLTNPRVTLRNTKNQGYLDNTSRGEYAINTVGENLVAMTLPMNGSAGAPARRTARQPARAPSDKKKPSGTKKVSKKSHKATTKKA